MAWCPTCGDSLCEWQESDKLGNLLSRREVVVESESVEDD